MRGQKDLRTMKKGVSKIENKEEMFYKIIQNCQMRDLVKLLANFRSNHLWN